MCLQKCSDFLNSLKFKTSSYFVKNVHSFKKCRVFKSLLTYLKNVSNSEFSQEFFSPFQNFFLKFWKCSCFQKLSPFSDFVQKLKNVPISEKKCRNFNMNSRFHKISKHVRYFIREIQVLYFDSSFSFAMHSCRKSTSVVFAFLEWTSARCRGLESQVSETIFLLFFTLTLLRTANGTAEDDCPLWDLPTTCRKGRNIGGPVMYRVRALAHGRACNLQLSQPNSFSQLISIASHGNNKSIATSEPPFRSKRKQIRVPRIEQAHLFCKID